MGSVILKYQNGQNSVINYNLHGTWDTYFKLNKPNAKKENSIISLTYEARKI